MKDLIKTLKIFYKFLSRKRFWFVLFLIVKLTSNILSAVLPYFYKLFADTLQDMRYEHLLTLLVWMIVLRFAGLITHMSSFFINDIVLFDAAINIRKKVFKHLQDLDFAFHTKKSTGSLISAIKRGDSALWSLNHSIHHRFLEVIVRFGVMIIFLGALDFRITLVTIFSFLLALLATKYLVELNMKARMRHNDEEDNISAIIVDNLVNFETVKLFAKEKRELLRLDQAYKPWLKYGWKYLNTFRVIDGTTGTIINISIFVILYYTLQQAQALQMTVGEFVLV